MNEITLSYSTINMIHRASHNWLNKMCGLKPEERPEWAVGKKIHRIVQDHISGKKRNLYFNHIKDIFPIVEEKDFDERCKFEFPIVRTKKVEDIELKTNYKMIGFLDGIDFENNRYLEIKSSDPMWSVGKFQKDMQRKVYALAFPKFTDAYLITCSKHDENWGKDEAKIFKVPLTKKDRDEALKWINEGIDIIEEGRFDGGLDENGVCTDPWCYYGCNCQWKQ